MGVVVAMKPGFGRDAAVPVSDQKDERLMPWSLSLSLSLSLLFLPSLREKVPYCCSSWLTSLCVDENTARNACKLSARITRLAGLERREREGDGAVAGGSGGVVTIQWRYGN